MSRFCVLLLTTFVLVNSLHAAEPDAVLNLWPGTPPGPPRDVPGEEKNMSGPDSRTVAGRPVIRLGNVTTPQAHVFLPPADNRTGSAVVICPGGGYSILAWDLEGTEVAEWLNSLGVAAIVVKYRVPTRHVEPKWLLPVQDAQRAISITRSHAKKWQIDSRKIAVLGFSAGGDTAARTALATKRFYAETDSTDNASCRPDAAILVYPAYLTNADRTGLAKDIRVDKTAPPCFLVHAFDDPVTPESSLYLALAMKKAAVPCELHLFDAGGHGYGLRPVPELPVTTWPTACAAWLKRNQWITQP